MARPHFLRKDSQSRGNGHACDRRCLERGVSGASSELMRVRPYAQKMKCSGKTNCPSFCCESGTDLLPSIWLSIGMGKRKVLSRSKIAEVGRSARTGQAGPQHAPLTRLVGAKEVRGWRLWLARASLALLVPALVLLAGEGLFRLVGAGYPTTFCLTKPGAQVVTENSKFLFQFYTPKTNLRPNPFAVALAKPAGAVRVVVLGESAAAGTPEPAYGFGRILERMLRDLFPQKRIEVISAAMRGVNSHVLLPTARDCLRLKPDLFIVYMGNNETVGLYAPGPRSGRLTAHLSLLRLVQWVSATRLGQLVQPWLQSLTHEGAPAGDQDDAFWAQHRLAADDSRRAAVYDNFQDNLADICQVARRAGAGVILMTVAANLKDCPPFGSLHSAQLSEADRQRWESAYHAGMRAEAADHPQEAITNYMSAAKLDDRYAELHFRLGRLYYGLGQFDQARAEFVLARDWDALQFRADSRLNAIIRNTAAQAQDPAIRLVDAERALMEAEPEHHIPGQRLFRDHVHPSFDGDYELARALLPRVVEALARELAGTAPQSKPILTREECAARLAFSRLNEAQIAAGMLDATAHPPFTAQLDHGQRQKAAEQATTARFGNLGRQDLEVATEMYRTAMRLYPDDWQLPYNFGRILLSARDYGGAAEQFRAAKRLLPHWMDVRLALSTALNRNGHSEEALQELNDARAMDPRSEAVMAGIAAVKGQTRAGSP
jgi:tetratricopeptide (TPR) repeat protein